MNEFIKMLKLDDLFVKYVEEVGEVVIDDDFGYGFMDIGNVSYVVLIIYFYIKIGLCNLVGYMYRFREVVVSVYGDEVLIKGVKIMVLMGLELIIN